jgi:hypothetical protein
VTRGLVARTAVAIATADETELALPSVVAWERGGAAAWQRCMHAVAMAELAAFAVDRATLVAALAACLARDALPPIAARLFRTAADYARGLVPRDELNRIHTLHLQDHDVSVVRVRKFFLISAGGYRSPRDPPFELALAAGDVVEGDCPRVHRRIGDPPCKSRASETRPRADVLRAAVPCPTAAQLVAAARRLRERPR